MRLRSRSTTIGSMLVLGLTMALVAFTGSAGSAGTSQSTTLPPKVKTSTARPSSVHLPGGGASALAGATRLGFCGGDDWEPEIAADPAGSYVYVVLAHYPGDPTCDPSSGNPNRVYIQVSSDGGKTFGPQHVVADTIGGADYPSQVDCVVSVDPVTGAVYVSFLIYGLQGVQTDVAVAKSTDHGATFTAVKVNGPECKNCDHPWTIAHGNDVYTAYAHGKNHYLSHSSNGGLTWTESNVLREDTVAFPEGAVLDAAGNAWFAWGDCKTSSCNGNTAGNYRVSRTLAGTSTTAFALVASAPAGPKCPYAPNCGFAYFGIQNDVAIDAAGNFYMVWQDGQDHTKAGSPPIVQLSRCLAGSDCTNPSSWSYVGRADDKNASGCADSACYALFPRIEGGAANQIGVMWMDDRKGRPVDHTNGWNVWYRTSATGGATWSGSSTRVSQYDPSRPESQPNGFKFPYGDYEGIDLRTAGPKTKAVMIWGEGTNYTGTIANPGHVIYRTLAT
ncbi:MAG TPA: sialidase family protein [Actinomycetota bacterium]